jgi:hypothetical protein
MLMEKSIMRYKSEVMAELDREAGVRVVAQLDWRDYSLVLFRCDGFPWLAFDVRRWN